MAKKYSKNELGYLEKYAPTKTVEELAKELNRSVLSISTRLRRLNTKPKQINPHYTKDDEAYIIKNFNKKTPKQMVNERFYNRHPNSVLRKAYELGCSKGLSGHHWKPEEEAVILRMGGVTFDHEIQEHLPHISIHAIGRKRRELKIAGRRPHSDAPKKTFDGQVFTLDKKGRNYIGRYNGRPTSLHRAMFEKELGRKLSKEESVHHIDGDFSNEDRVNLHLYDTHSAHMKAHHSLENIVFKLYKERKVGYDKEHNEYYLQA